MYPRASSATLAFLLAGAVCPSTAFAEDRIELAQLDRITVIGQRDGYAIKVTESATKTPTPLVDVPQTVSVLSEDFIADLGLRSIADVSRYVPGVLIGQGEGHRDQITIRGNNSTADFYIDGIRDDVQYFRPLYNLARVEVLKGPNALIFGRGGGGGVVNRVAKAAQEERFVGASVSADTFGDWSVGVDLNAPIAPGVKARLNAFYEQLDNHRDAYDGERFAVNPVVAFDLGANTQLGLSYEYVEDDRVIDRGVPSQDDGDATRANRPLGDARARFFGDPDLNRTVFSAHVVRANLHHRFSDALELNSRILFGDYDKLYTNVFPVTPAPRAGDAQTIAIEAYTDPTDRRNLFSQSDLVWKVATGPLEHVVLAGIEISNQLTRNQRINGFFDGPGVTVNATRLRATIPFADPLPVPEVTFRAGSGNRSVRSILNVQSIYLQDQVSIGDHWDLIAGARVDRFALDVENQLAGQRFERTDTLVSPRAGLIYKPVESASVYFSYARSFLPQSGDQFVSLDLSLAALEPERFNSYEVGAKWDILDNLSATVALYRLDRTNTRAAGPTPGVILLTGRQRSRGLEFGLVGNITQQWQVSAAYTLQDAEITQTTTAAPAGRAVAQTPRHVFALWNRYDVVRRLGVGFGVYHQSQSFNTISNTSVLPSYTRLDAALYVPIVKGVEAQVNIENLTNARYFPTAHTDNNISTGAPVNARFSLNARF